MATVGVSNNDVARHFDIHKITAYRTINRFWQSRSGRDHPKSERPKKKLHLLEECFFHIT